MSTTTRPTPSAYSPYPLSVKQEDGFETNRSRLPPLNTHPRYDSALRDSRPPPPAAYVVASDQDELSKHSRSATSSRKYQSYCDDPIPPPPEKYTYPLPSISEAWKAREVPGPAAPSVDLARSYRRYSNDSHSADRYTQSREYTTERGPVRTPYTGPPAIASAAGASYESERHPSSSDARVLHTAPPVRAMPDVRNRRQSPLPVSPSHEQWRPGHGPPPSEGHYYSQYKPSVPYAPRRAPSRDIMPPLPAPSTTTIYAPSLSNPRPTPIPPSTSAHSARYRDEAVPKPRKPIYGESVKRHLDTFDLESALNVMSESSQELLEFSEFYRQKAHNTQRTGPLPGSTPHVGQIDDMMKHGNRVQESLNRLRDVATTQAAEEAENTRRREAKLAAAELSQQEDTKGDGGFAGSDAKKRRGRAAPPGKCHSCNRVDTPEWRRGPDGARTLCNACGLHYAKLTRKSGTKAANGASTLQNSIDEENAD